MRRFFKRFFHRRVSKKPDDRVADIKRKALAGAARHAALKQIALCFAVANETTVDDVRNAMHEYCLERVRTEDEVDHGTEAG